MAHAGDEWRKGWTVVLACAAGAGMSSVQTVALSLLIKPLSEEFGWSRAAISASVTITMIGALLLSPLVGSLVDRFGSRRIGLAGITMKSIALGGVALATPELWTWLTLWAMVAVTAPFASLVIWTKAVASRFDRNRGLALAITLAGLSIANAIFSLIAAQVFASLGWRGVYVVLAGLAFLISFSLSWFFLYDASDLTHRHGDKGLRKVPAISKAERSLLLRNPRLWRIVLPVFCVAIALGGLTIHLPSILSDFGMSQTRAAVIFSIAFGPCALFGRLVTGTLLDRVHAPFVTAVAFTLPLCASALFLFAGSSFAALSIAAGVAGLALGAEMEALAYLISRYFGARHYGFLYGIGYGLYAMGYGLGPLVAGLFFDHQAAYTGFFLLVILIAVVCVPIIATLGRPPMRAPDVRDQAAATIQK